MNIFYFMPDLFINPEDSAKQNTSSETKAVLPTENHIHALSSYCEHPSYLALEGKDIHATVKFFLRRHLITNIPWLFTTIVLLFIPLLIQALITISGTVLPPLPNNFITVFLLLYYLIGLTYAFINFLDWFYNIIIITDNEIIDVDYSDVILHNVAATKVSLVEDVQYKQSGFIEGLFNFGDLFVQTAGGHENIEALKIPQPARIARIVLEFIGKGGAH